MSSFSDDCGVDVGDTDFIDSLVLKLLIDPPVSGARRCCVRHHAKIEDDNVHEEPIGGSKDGVLTLATEFMYGDGNALEVQLAGSWNDWVPVQMKKAKISYCGTTWWRVVTPVLCGKHEFKFIVDGAWKKSEKHPSKFGNNVREVTDPHNAAKPVAAKQCCIIV